GSDVLDERRQPGWILQPSQQCAGHVFDRWLLVWAILFCRQRFDRARSKQRWIDRRSVETADGALQRRSTSWPSLLRLEADRTPVFSPPFLPTARSIQLSGHYRGHRHGPMRPFTFMPSIPTRVRISNLCSAHRLENGLILPATQIWFP